MAWIDKIVMPMGITHGVGIIWRPLLALVALASLHGCSLPTPTYVSADDVLSQFQERPESGRSGVLHVYTIGGVETANFTRGESDLLVEAVTASAPGWDVSYSALNHEEDATVEDEIRKQCIPAQGGEERSVYWVLLENSSELESMEYLSRYLVLDRDCHPLAKQTLRIGSNDMWGDEGYTVGRFGASKIGSVVLPTIYSTHNEYAQIAVAEVEKKAADEVSRLAEQQRQESLQQAELQRQQLAARMKGQPCPSREPGWFYLKGRCNKQHQPKGQGEAETDDRSWRYVGEFKAGQMVNGTFSQNGQPIFLGGMQNGRFEGKGRCAVNGTFEACEFRQGQRVDALFQQRMAQLQAQELAIRQAEAEDAANRARHEEARQQRQALAQKITECRRSAEEQSGINTTCTCDAAGEIYCNNHNKGINALLGALDGISAAAQESADASTESLNNMIAAQRAAELQAQSEADQYGGEPAPAATLSENERAAIAAQVAAQLATPQPTVTTPVATQPKPVAQSTESSASTKQLEAEPVSNNEILPEAVAVCRKNGGGYWFCDGPIQMTSVGEQGEEGLAKVRATSGCRSPRSQAGTTSDGWTIYLCGYGLDSYDRDLVSIRHLVLPRLSYNCPNAKDKDPSDHKCHQAYTTIEHY